MKQLAANLVISLFTLLLASVSMAENPDFPRGGWFLEVGADLPNPAWGDDSLMASAWGKSNTNNDERYPSYSPGFNYVEERNSSWDYYRNDRCRDYRIDVAFPVHSRVTVGMGLAARNFIVERRYGFEYSYESLLNGESTYRSSDYDSGWHDVSKWRYSVNLKARFYLGGDY